ncbi:MAG: acyl-CoA dehydrogenase family protein [Gammaproteobacteria bacterium]|jgi:putative acyl-CoA dehydrogenase|nr:acyl-CoA dehydrogenase family protein [Gammaproteobacteria bacterium]
MLPSKPLDTLPTHSVTNMPPYLGDQDLWHNDPALQAAVSREGADWAQQELAALGSKVGTSDMFDKAEQANRFSPELKAYDRYGMRINQVVFHPAYHDLMQVAIEHQVASFAWNNPGPGSQVGHVALSYMFNQVEAGTMCPMAMTYSAIPALQTTPAIARDWIPRLLSRQYDARDIPVTEKTGATIGMFMTEKQGGSDVRANSTQAVPAGSHTGIGAEYRLTGHKYFCSAPMSDAFLTLAYTPVGLSCFIVPRWTPDGVRNGLYMQRLKDKLGNRSNASAEMELQDTWGIMVGEEGRGVRTIIDMVQGTRIYCCVGSAALMRQGLVQAVHHTRHRHAFGKLLIDQPLMRNVLADLALESEAAMALSLRIAHFMDAANGDQSAASLARFGTAIGKFWNCKRAPAHLFEAMECHGGPGYVEESILPRLYREAPVNSIWEGSGNVMCLDVLRAMQREPDAVPALLAELELARGGHAELDRAIAKLKLGLTDTGDLEHRARQLTQQIALVWQGALLVQHAPAAVADAFCATRLGSDYSGVFGVLPKGCEASAIINRAVPA